MIRYNILTGINTLLLLFVTGIGFGQLPVKVYEQPLAIPTYMVAPAETSPKDEGLDFFEKFGTDMSKDIKKARFHYHLALAYLGIDNKINAKAELEMALKLNVNHVWANTHFKNYLNY